MTVFQSLILPPPPLFLSYLLASFSSVWEKAQILVHVVGGDSGFMASDDIEWEFIGGPKVIRE